MIAFYLAPILAKMFGFTVVTSRLLGRVRKASGEWIDYGVLGYRMVTTVAVTAMSTSFWTPASPGTFYYHGLGTGAGAEAIGNTTLTTELTTEYNPDNTRATGTHVVGGSAGVYRTVATNTVDAPAAVTEHGIFTQAATGGGSLLDKTLFAVVNLAAGDSFVSTYELSFVAGG